MPIRLTHLNDPFDRNAMNVTNLAAASAPRYSRQILNLVDTTDRNATATWTLGQTWGWYSMKAFSTLVIYYMIPARNESTSWGGIYFEPQITYNSGTTWFSLGSRGHDMMSLNAAGNIRYVDNYMFIDPGQSADFSFGIRFYFRSYDGTVGLNNGQGHDLNANSGTAIYKSWPIGSINNQQHYTHFIVEERALLKG